MLIGHQDLQAQSQDWIKDVTTSTFVKDVLEASLKKPVLVEFWAPWCSACKTLMPILEKLAQEAKGQWILAKVNVETNPQIKTQLQIQGLPTVYLFQSGRPIDGFMGVTSETQVRQFLTSHRITFPEPQGDPIAEAESLWNQELFEQAIHFLTPYLDQNPQEQKGQRLLILCLYALGQREQAQELFLALPRPLPQDISHLEFLFELIAKGKTQNAPADTSSRDLQTLYDLSLHQFAKGTFSQAMDTLIKLLTIDKEWPEARQTLLKMINVIGIDHPLSHCIRRQLSTILFA